MSDQAIKKSQRTAHSKHQNIIIATLGRRAEAVTGKGHMERASGDIGKALFLDVGGGYEGLTIIL